MPITSSDIVLRLSGGGGNTSGDASLGGAISSTSAPSTLNGLFDAVSGAEATSGDTEYRCVYVKNNNGSLTLVAPYIWVQTNTPSTDTTIAIGLGTAAVDATEQTITDESTAPSGVSFSSPASYAAGLAITDLAAGSYKAIWIRRTVTAGASAYANDTFTLRVQGETS